MCVFQILAINFQCRGHVSRSYYVQVCSFRVNLCVYTIQRTIINVSCDFDVLFLLPLLLIFVYFKYSLRLRVLEVLFLCSFIYGVFALSAVHIDL